jgi:tetratricopeptide (TPR) repeat protein
VDLAEQLGEALYKAGEYVASEQVLEGVARRSTEAEQRTRARYNGGLAAYRGGRLAQAVEDWKEVLAEAPEHPAARQNLQAVEQEIARRMEPPPPPQGDPQQGDGQEDSGQQQEGQPQEGQPQEGQPQDDQPQDGQPQDGQPQGGAEQAPGGPAGEGQIQEAAGQPEQGTDTGSDQVAGSSKPGELTEEGAHRLLDSVDEGQPTVGDPRRPPGGKEW